MFHRTLRVCLPIAALLVAVATTARAADPLKIIPHDALGWGVIHHLTDGDAKIQKLAEIVGAPQVSVLDVVKDKVGIKKGLDANGAMGVIVMPPKANAADGLPPFVVFVAITDYDAFLANFEPEKKGEKITEVQIADEKSVVAHTGDYAIFAKSDDRDTLEKVLACKETIAEEAAPLKTWLISKDANIVATKAGLKLLISKGKTALKTSRESLDALGDQGKALKPMFDMYASALETAETNVAFGALGAMVDKAGNAHIAARAKLAADAPLAATFSNVKPGDGNLLAGLSGGEFVFAGGGMMPPSFIEAMTNMSFTMMKNSPETYGISKEQLDKLAKVSMQGMKTVRGMAIVMKTAAAGEPIYSNVHSVMTVDNADQFLENYEKQLVATRDILKDVKEGMLKPPTVKKIEIDGKKALELEMTIPVPPTPGNPMGDKIMDAMFGPDRKSTIYITKGGEKTIYMTFGVTKEKLIQAIADGKEKSKSFQAEPDVAATVSLLPAGSQGIMLLSVPGFATMEMQLMQAMMGANGLMFQIPPFPKCPAIGFAVQAAPGELSAELAFPAAMMKAVGDYTYKIQRRFAPQGPQIP